MKTIESLLVEIIAVLDTPATRNLALDAWRVGQLKGEAEGVAFAEMVLAGVLRFVDHGRAVAGKEGLCSKGLGRDAERLDLAKN